METDALPLEYKLEQLRTSRDLELPYGVDYSLLQRISGVLSGRLQEEPLHFSGVNACPAANDFADSLLVVHDAVEAFA